MLKTLKIFYSFILRKKIVFAVFLAITVASSILGSITPYFLKLFVDAIPNLNYQKLVFILISLMAVRVGAWIFDILSFFIGDFILIDAARDARTTIFKYVQDLDFAFHSSKSTGSLISAFKRGDGAFFDIFHAIHHRILDIAIGVVVMIYFFTGLDLRIGFIVLGSLAVTIFVTRFLIKHNMETRSKFNKEEDKISAVITDNLINFETVKLFARENFELTRLKNAFNPWREKLWGFANSFRFIDITVGVIINISLFLIFLLSLRLAVDLKITLGDFVLIVGFVGAFFPRLWDLVWGFRDIAKNYSDIQTYFGLLDYQVEVKDPSNPVKIDHVYGEVEFKNIYFSYKGRRKNAIDGINLKVRQGQSIALVGRSGSGKTTLVKLLMRFYDVNSGEILVDGINIKDFDKSTLRSFIGVVPQEPILFNNSISYNIAYGKDSVSQKEIEAAAKLANINNFIESLPEKYNTEVGERGVKLSGGQKQRLAIARMILSDPEIIIFDEATSHLDSESEKLIQEAFWKASQNKTTIIIAHRLSTVMRADKIVVMEKGKIKETGSHKQLLGKEDSLYKHFWDLQINID